MTRTVEVKCKCGEVRGELRGATPRTVNRMFCYCADCQAALHHLGRPDLLDAHGGVDIVQMAPDMLTIVQGKEHIRCLRLTPKGLYRWHTDCCKTPFGNTVKPSIPFVGLFAALFRDPDADASPSRGAVNTACAIDGIAPGVRKAGIGDVLHAVRLFAGWKLGGRAWPHPFFDKASGEPTAPTTILTAAEREALRPLCGPKPTR